MPHENPETSQEFFSPLHEEHVALGAHFTHFGGWTMPLKYSNELAEHRGVRDNVGLFDLCHMGEVRITGPHAALYLDYACVSHLSAVKPGRAKYTMLVNEQGGIIDDLIIYRLADTEYLAVPNAGNRVVDVMTLQERATGFDVRVTEESFDTVLFALQGPNAERVLSSLLDATTRPRLTELSYYSARPLPVAGITTFVSRTGYTGEDGYELYAPASDGVALWRALLGAVTEAGGCACGLAARDSLRLEAGMPLYGHELTLAHTPFDAGLGFVVGKKKTDPFVGSTVLLNPPTPEHVLVGLRGQGRRAAREGCEVYAAEALVGRITSGQLSPTLGYPIALAYVGRQCSEPGTTLDVDVRGKKQKMTITPLPFYRRA